MEIFFFFPSLLLVATESWKKKINQFLFVDYHVMFPKSIMALQLEIGVINQTCGNLMLTMKLGFSRSTSK